jgi:hypothetical protein
MAKVRSPNYPLLNLSEALGAMRPVYLSEHKNKMARETLAKHLGYNSLNGRALGKIGAVRAYGLIEGSGDELRVSEDAIIALMAPEDSPERQNSLAKLVIKPALFKEIRDDFPDVHPSESNLKFWLIKQGFTPEAAGKAATTYLETMKLVSNERAKTIESAENNKTDAIVLAQQQIQADNNDSQFNDHSEDIIIKPISGVRREVITLDEGDVIVSFPEKLSPQSVNDLKDHLDLFVRKLQRRTRSFGHD